MTTRVALLRAINVGGSTVVSMQDLRGMLEGLGFSEVRSLLQTGNLVFQTDGRGNAELETMLEEAAGRQLGLRTDFLVRDAQELSNVILDNPFPKEAEADPSHLLILFLKAAVSPGRVEALQSAIAGRELVRLVGRHLYAIYPDGIGRSKLTNAFIESRIGTRTTGRNWNTILKLNSLASS